MERSNARLLMIAAANAALGLLLAVPIVLVLLAVGLFSLPIRFVVMAARRTSL
jgi:hypothetical protein